MEFNLADLFECVADTVGSRPAVVFGSRRLTYSELDSRATRLAHGLREMGISAGDHVGVQLYDSPEFLETMLACYKLRAVPVNVNWRYSSSELAHLYRDADLVGLVYPHELSSVVSAAGPPRVAVASGPSYESLVSSGSADRDFGPRSADDHYILYTGGTTGLPKGVVWRQEDIFFAVLGGGNSGGPPITSPPEIARSVMTNRALRIGTFLPPGDPGPEQFIQLSLSPLMHAGGQWSALTTLLGGGRVVLYPERHVDMERVLALVSDESVGSLNLVGDANGVPLVSALRAYPERWDVSSVRLIGSGGAMLSGRVKAALFECFPRLLAISEGIGSSEAPVMAATVTTRTSAVAARSLHFSARPETAVFDEAWQRIAPGSGAVGRLATRGRVPLGYYNDAAKTARTFVSVDGERWALPGDMATVEADGTIRLLGRGALCINTGGEKVYPEEVEAVLKMHPEVSDAVVVGRTDAQWGERVVAIVSLALGTPVELTDLQAHCRERLAGYKVPRELRVVDRVERTPSGKADYQWARMVVDQF